MPGIDGLEACRVIRAELGGACPQIIALTANAIAGDRERYLESGFDGYLSKPIAVAELKRLLHRGIRAVVLDHDAEQIEALRKFGFKVYYGDASRHDLLEAAGAAEAKALVIAIDDREKALDIVETARRHFPGLQILARAFDRVHAYRLINAGVEDVHREVFSSSVDMGEKLLVRLGVHPFEAHRAARRFKSHDEELIRRAAKHIDDTQRLIDIARQGREEIERVLATDAREKELAPDHAWEAPDASRKE